MIPRIMLLCSIFTLLCSAASAQPSDESEIHAPDQQDQGAQAAIEAGDDSLLGILDFNRYKFRDFTLYWDNDGTLANLIDDTDRYYTNANAIEFSFDPQLNPALASRLAISDEGEQRFGVGIALKQRIYTPANLLLPNPPARDHPYAGHLALVFSFQRADNDTHDHFGFSLGLTGHSSGSETVQGWVHNTFPDEDDPLGWNTQIPGEPTLNFAYTRTWKSKPANIAGLEIEMLPSLGFDLGTVLVDARSSMTLRFGKNLPSDFGPASLLGHRDHTVRTNEASESNWSIYGYTKLGVDAIAHDIFLDGTVFAGSRSAQREPLVATFTFGLILQYESFYFGWSQSIQSERFELQPDRQTFGSMVFGCSFAW
jgi:lipid A 3-O-deacylase